MLRDVDPEEAVALEPLNAASLFALSKALETMEMLDEADVITESHAGREAVFAKVFIDSTVYGDLAGFAGGW